MHPRSPFTSQTPIDMAAHVPSVKSTLLIEDDPHFGAWVMDILKRDGRFGRLCHVDSVEAARREIAACEPSLAIIDLNLPDGSGVDAIREISAIQEKLAGNPVILVLTAIDDPSIALEALRAGAQGYIIKSTSEPLSECTGNVARTRSCSRRGEREFEMVMGAL